MLHTGGMSGWKSGVSGVVLLAMLALAPEARADTNEQLDTGCPSGTGPSFVQGTPFAMLKARLGDAMGAAVSCLISDPASGDALQFTDTGLAAYHKVADLAMFTNGDRHWALSGGGLVQWDQGPIQVQVIPPDAVAATSPVAQSPTPYCGVDLVTEVQAHTGPTGDIQSDTTQMGVAGKCFDGHFRACTPAIMATYVLVGSYRDQIDGPVADGRCRVVSSFLDNINPDLTGKQMTCELDNTRSIFDAVQDRGRCSGPLYDLLYAGS
jgi:hypothetical protein